MPTYTKLTAKAVVWARSKRKAGWTYTRIAAQIGCSESIIQRYCQGLQPKFWTGRGNSAKIIQLAQKGLGPKVIAERLGLTYSCVKTRQSQLRKLGRLAPAKRPHATAVPKG